MISLDAAKAHLNVVTIDDDTLIQSKIFVAWAWISLYTGTDYEVATVDDSGFPETEDVSPAPVNEAALQLVAHLYANREASLVGVTAQALPFGLLDLLAPYRAYAF